MNITFECFSCSQRIETNEDGKGQTIQCPNCHIDLIIPDWSQIPKTVPTISQRKPTRYRWFVLIGALVVLPLLALIILKTQVIVNFLGDLSTSFFGCLYLVGILLLGVIVIFWWVCLILLPIYVYQIHKTLLKIEKNTHRSNNP